jgi:class 3 adenylate cyclase/pimeloyl-ACP methyl ester carboxylesterase
MWEEPGTAHCFERMSAYARLIMFDRRGTGLSDAVSSPPTLEQQMDDLDAVLDAVQSEQIALFGASDLGLSALYAATYPDRVTALVLSGVAADGSKMISPDNRSVFLDAIEHHWGDGTLMELYAPSQAGNRVFADWWARMQRSAVSPGMARQLMEMITQTDLGAVLPAIRAPTLVTHVQDDRIVPVQEGRAVAALIPGARFIVYPGTDAYAWAQMPGLDDIEEFLTGRRAARPLEADRVLATVLFTDIVGSTARASQLGDGPWRALLDEHNRTVRAELASWRGTEIKTIGDGFLATFDGPARAVNCAAAIVDSLADLNLPIRAGVHTGECELLGDDVAGIAVHIGARVMERAGPGEVLASSTVKDLVFGSGLQFSDRGVHALRGVPDEWRLFALER